MVTQEFLNYDEFCIIPLYKFVLVECTYGHPIFVGEVSMECFLLVVVLIYVHTSLCCSVRN